MAETNTPEPQRDDLIANEEDLEKALCVLAGSDPENCSYSRGYVKRQAVFACNTCTPNSAEPAGICLACANKCHDGHDIFELYTKRNFRCDCGNNKFRDFQCQLIPAKDNENTKNLYSHNFSGCYCTCDRPYPDPDDQVNDEMIQCVVCEDWFHTRHLHCTMVEPEELLEMVCEACMNKAPFLWTYAAQFAVVSEKDEEVDVEGEVRLQHSSAITNEEPSTSLECKKQEGAETRRLPYKRSRDEMTDSPGKSKTTACKLKDLQAQNVERPRRGAVFWPCSWRSELCTCVSCKRAYVAAQVHFLMDETDSVVAYENRGLDEPFGQHPLMAVTSSMTRVQQLEFIYGYKELTAAITAFFHQCAAEKKLQRTTSRRYYGAK
ncbi:putative E3 ubiquitin-protein ligase UBR7 isoform X2 [Nerophis ophidion]|uniref:putative E3 ubiquitin-protein ligase UBR7 isoform X2 n=1 Tax=Nerophis ophidion TaxID=159077 RepID=UPI002ADF3FDB|nr:putative E3 ubiquitin-protein ligase UBR7 isoform X2 [Nerophis ophidion]